MDTEPAYGPQAKILTLSTGNERLVIDRYITAFEAAMQQGKKNEIEHARKELLEYLASIH